MIDTKTRRDEDISKPAPESGQRRLHVKEQKTTADAGPQWEKLRHLRQGNRQLPLQLIDLERWTHAETANALILRQIEASDAYSSSAKKIDAKTRRDDGTRHLRQRVASDAYTWKSGETTADAGPQWERLRHLRQGNRQLPLQPIDV